MTWWLLFPALAVGVSLVVWLDHYRREAKFYRALSERNLATANRFEDVCDRWKKLYGESQEDSARWSKAYAELFDESMRQKAAPTVNRTVNTTHKEDRT